MKLNNKGYFLNITIIVIIVVSFIITGCLAIVMANWNMKKTEREVQKNYYSTEMAMNDIRAGVEECCSEKIKDAYSILISSLNTVPYDKLNEEFKNIYVDGLKEKYANDKLVETLKGYLENPEENKISIVSNPTLDVTMLDSNKVYLRNIGVSHVSENGVYLSRIFTDIEISIPQLYDGVEVSSTFSVSFTDFALIADKELQINGTTTVNGGIYAGNYYNNEGKLDGGIKLGATNETATCDFTSQKVITRGDILLDKGSTLKLKGISGNSDVYANNFIIKRGNTYSNIAADLTANMFLAGDTLLNASNGDFKLDGNYYGYSTGNSAFCINGSNVDADLSGVKTLWIAGSSYIDFSDSNSINSSDVLMGESLTYKGTQSMYLMPSVCIRRINSDGSVGDSLSNPLTAESGDSLDTSKFTIVLEENQKNGGIDLKKYVDEANPYRAVHVKDKNGNGNKVYLYLNFTNTKDENDKITTASSHASNYAKDFAKLNQEYMNDRAKSFNLGRIVLGENTSLRTMGNVVTYAIPENDKPKTVTVTTGSLSMSSDFASYKETYFRNKYNSLVSTLQEYKTSTQNDSLFEYLIKTDEITNNILSGVDNSIFNCDTTSYYETDANGYQVLVTNDDVIIKSDFSGLVIAKGDIKVPSGVTVRGTLISGGQICVGNGTCNFYVLDDNGNSPIMYLLYEWCDKNNIRKYFKGFDEDKEADLDTFSLRSTIKYRNWVKE